jgi:hypothetical protein
MMPEACETTSLNQPALTRRTFGLWPTKDGGNVFGFVDIPVDVYAAASKLGKKRGLEAAEVLGKVCSRVGIAAKRPKTGKEGK